MKKSFYFLLLLLLFYYLLVGITMVYYTRYYYRYKINTVVRGDECCNERRLIIISKIYTFEIGLIYYYTVKKPGTGTRMG